MKNITLLRGLLVEIHNARKRALKALRERNIEEMDKEHALKPVHGWEPSTPNCIGKERDDMTGMCIGGYDCVTCENLNKCCLLEEWCMKSFYQAMRIMIEEANL